MEKREGRISAYAKKGRRVGVWVRDEERTDRWEEKEAGESRGSMGEGEEKGVGDREGSEKVEWRERKEVVCAWYAHAVHTLPSLARVGTSTDDSPSPVTFCFLAAAAPPLGAYRRAEL